MRNNLRTQLERLARDELLDFLEGYKRKPAFVDELRQAEKKITS